MPTNGWCGPLYEEQAAKLILYGRALGLSHSEVEDVVQEVFSALLELPSAPGRPHHYAIRAFRNRALNYKRSFMRRMLRELEARHWFEPNDDASPGERRAVQSLERLPPEQREVIVLKIWHGHTFEEIGELLGLSPNTAAGRYRYGLQKLRTCLNEGTYEREESDGESAGILDTARAIPVRGDVSSQFLTALLLALPLVSADGPVAIEVVGELISKPYIEITLNLLARFGIAVQREGWQRFTIPQGSTYRSPGSIHVEADASSASYFVALGAIAAVDAPVRIEGVGFDSIQGDIRFVEAAQAMGAQVDGGPGWLAVRRGRWPLKALDLD